MNPTNEHREQAREKLTPEQVANWRRVLVLTLGPYALLMPDDQVQQYKDRMQNAINESN